MVMLVLPMAIRMLITDHDMNSERCEKLHAHHIAR